MKQKILNIFSSTRFWAIVFGAIVVYLRQKGFIDQYLMELITTILGGHIVINTVDKFSDKSTNTTVSIPSGVSTVTASKEPTPAMENNTGTMSTPDI